MSFDKLRQLHERLAPFDSLFDDDYENTPENFINTFLGASVSGEITLRGLIWEVDDVGILYLTDMIPGREAKAHFTFWDGRIRGREGLVRRMTEYVIRTLGFPRIYTRVPLYAPAIIKAVERMGFVKEGRLRRVVKRNGNWCDAYLFSLLDIEVEDGLRTTG